MSFGENLQYLRAEESITQEDLAERLAVSRQTVSKWEADASFPEMDKLLTLCDMFRCDLDTLLRGSVQASRQTDTAGYDEHMNRFSKMITAGVALCICGFSAAALLENAQGGHWSGPVFLLFVLAAVVLFITGGIQHNDFCAHHPHIEPFYDKKTLERWRQRFPVFISVGAALCIGGVILMSALEGLYPGKLPPSSSTGIAGTMEGGAYVSSEDMYFLGEDIAVSLGLLIVAAGVSSLVYGSMQNAKYHIEAYNKERRAENSPQYKRVERIHSVIMLSAAAIFLIYFVIWKLSDFPGHGIGLGAMAIFGVGGMLCAIASSILKKDDPSDSQFKD